MLGIVVSTSAALNLLWAVTEGSENTLINTKPTTRELLKFTLFYMNQ